MLKITCLQDNLSQLDNFWAHILRSYFFLLSVNIMPIIFGLILLKTALLSRSYVNFSQSTIKVHFHTSPSIISCVVLFYFSLPPPNGSKPIKIVRAKGYIYIWPLNLTSWFIFYALLKTMVKGGQGYPTCIYFQCKKEKNLLHFRHMWHLK